MGRNNGHLGHRVASIVAIGALLTMLGVSLAVPMLPTARAATTWNVYLNNYFYVPKNLNIEIGDTVVWTANVSTLHTVTSDTGAWTQMTFNGVGATGSHTFMTPGVFNYHCIYHSALGMTGSVTVGGAIPEFSNALLVVTWMMALIIGIFVYRDRRSRK